MTLKTWWWSLRFARIRVRKPLSIFFQKAHPHPLEDAMLHKISNGWLQDKAQVTALLLTLLFFTSLYLGFM